MALIPIPGLHHVLARKLNSAQWQREKVAKVTTDPRVAHDAEVSALANEKDIKQLSEQIQENEQTIDGIEVLIHTLRSSEHQSPHRTLALRELENASMRLRRENGDPVIKTA